VKNPLSFALGFLFVLCFPVSALADSDGYFCASNGYIAYELREGITPGVIGHVLRVVRFDSQNGIRSVGEVSLRDLQVHIMTCDEEHIEVAGFGTVPHGDAPLTKCVIDIRSSQREIRLSGCTDDATLGENWRKVVGKGPGNLGMWARAKSIPLDSADPVHRYYLQPSSSKKDLGQNSWEIHYETDLIQTDNQGDISQRFTVHETHIEASDSGD
jgi:hypothetical protein